MSPSAPTHSASVRFPALHRTVAFPLLGVSPFCRLHKSERALSYRSLLYYNPKNWFRPEDGGHFYNLRSTARLYQVFRLFRLDRCSIGRWRMVSWPLESSITAARILFLVSRFLDTSGMFSLAQRSLITARKMAASSIIGRGGHPMINQILINQIFSPSFCTNSEHAHAQDTGDALATLPPVGPMSSSRQP